MRIKFVSVCRLTAPAFSEDLTHDQSIVFFGKHKTGTLHAFEPFLLASKKVIHVEQLPHYMTSHAEVAEWFKTKEANFLFKLVEKKGCMEWYI
jgi:hypothetical protein